MTPDRIRSLRLLLGLSQDAFGRLLGLTPEAGRSFVSRLESGSRLPVGTTLTLLLLLERRPDLADDLRELSRSPVDSGQRGG